MAPTLAGMAIYAAIVAVVGALVLRYGRWRPPRVPPPAPRETDVHPAGLGCGVTLAIAVLIVIAVLLALWGVMAGRT